MRTSIWLVRHGQTELNRARRYQGAIDSPLTSYGLRQAAALARRLRRIPFSVALVSPALRAQVTAEAILAERDVPIIEEPRWREASHGRWEGLTYREVCDRFPAEASARFADALHGKPEGGESLAEVDGVVVGTPAYMPPEQARGEAQQLSRRSDVYSIGAMLYHLLVGHAPYVLPGTTVSARQILWRVIEGPPGRVSELAPAVPEELVAICDKAMARDPDQRYQDTRALGEDLRAYLEGRVVAAHETGALAELRKWVGRNKGLAAASAAAITALLGGFVTSSIFYVSAAESATLAKIERDRADNEAAAARRKADEVLRLSALQILEDLEAEADEMWPAEPSNLRRYEDWLRRANDLVAELPRYEEKLVEMRAKSRPLDEEERTLLRTRQPGFSALQAAQRELEYRTRLQAALDAGEPLGLPAAGESTALLASKPAVSGELDQLAWPLVDPDRTEFGSEPMGLLLARRAVELASTRPAPERAALRRTLAWACLANGMLDDAVHEARQALEEADAGGRAEFERGVAELERRIQHQISPEGMEEEEKRCGELRTLVAELEAEVSKAPSWTFDSSEDRWWHDQLAKLIAGVRELERGLLADDAISAEHGWGLGKRLAFARSIEERSTAGPEVRSLWAEAIASIRDAAECPAYGSLVLTPQLGLVPIGRDPDSGLWEFAHLQTGEPAVRGADGKLVLSEETGIVFVLIPGGTYTMGAQSSDPKRPNHDPKASPDEGPVRTVRLSPYFLGKYEMTQGQWLRFVGRNPSRYGPDDYERVWNRSRRPGDLLHPVEQVSWTDCVETLARLGLSLPSEAQWEHGCRGGTSSVYWCGDDPSTLQGVANLSDAFGKSNGNENFGEWEPWLDDGQSVHGEVGSYRANAFGLHDVHGNVWEWCQDGYQDSRNAGVNPVSSPKGARLRVLRGGGYVTGAALARSAIRVADSPELRGFALGLRVARRVTP